MLLLVRWTLDRHFALVHCCSPGWGALGHLGATPKANYRGTQRFRWAFRRDFSLLLQALFSACVLRTASANMSRSWSLVFAGSRLGGCQFAIWMMWGRGARS